jgi:hypothetical protein
MNIENVVDENIALNVVTMFYRLLNELSLGNRFDLTISTTSDYFVITDIKLKEQNLPCHFEVKTVLELREIITKAYLNDKVKDLVEQFSNIEIDGSEESVRDVLDVLAGTSYAISQALV